MGRRIGLLLVLLALAGALFLGCATGNGTLAVTVTDTAGAPLAGAKVVSQEQPAGQLKLTGITTATSNVVTFRDVRPGTYEIQVSQFNSLPQDVTAVVEAGRTASLVVKLVRAG